MPTHHRTDYADGLGNIISSSYLNEPNATINVLSGQMFNVKEGASPALGDGVTDDTTAILARLTAAKSVRGWVYIPPGDYLVSSLVLDYSADTPDATYKGLRPPAVLGAGARSTILRQKAASTGPIISILGADSGNLHDGKMTGVNIGGFELRGIATQPGVKLSIYQFAHLHDMWITGCSDGIFLDRPVKSPTRDDHGHMIELQSVKCFQNSGWGLQTSLVNSVGPVDAHNCEFSFNTSGGVNMSSSNFGLSNCGIFGNAGPGIVSTEPTDVDSDAFGPHLFNTRLEGNCSATGTAEMTIDGGHAPTLVGVTVLASDARAPHCVAIGNGSNATRYATIVGGMFSGNGPSGTGTAGQKAFIFGANSLGAALVNAGVYTPNFADASVAANSMSVITNSGVGTFFGMALTMPGAFTVKTADYTATNLDDVIAGNNSGGAITITLPAVAVAIPGKRYTIKRINTQNVVIDGDGAETIDGVATKTLGSQYAFITLVRGTSSWLIVATGGTVT